MIKIDNNKNNKQTELLKIVDNFTGDVGIYVENLDTNKIIYSKNEKFVFASASIIKVPIMAYAVKKIFEGKLNLKALYTVDYTNMESENTLCEGSSCNLILLDIIKRMIIYSDNACTNFLIDMFTPEKLNNFFMNIELKNTKINRRMFDLTLINQNVQNYITIEDTANIYNKIYTNKLFGKSQCEFMMNILKLQTDRELIPKYLPSEYTYAGKTGGLDYLRHDAGFVFSKDKNLLILVFNQKVDNRANAEENIARFAEFVVLNLD